jgi:tetratricopeptide (TPR) repeat protein
MAVDWLAQEIETLEKRLKKQPRSPLFAQLAAYYLQADRTQDALRVCDEGLAHHPHYTTAHLVRGRILVALNMRAEARREIELVDKHLPGIDSVTSLLDQLVDAVERDLTQPSTTTEAPSTTVHDIARAENQPFEPEPFTEPTAVPTLTADEESPAPEEDVSPSAAALTESPFIVEEPTPVPSLFEAPAVAAPEESFEEYAARMGAELAGTENTLTWEDYVGGSATPQDTASHPAHDIESLAEKLQSAPKITPSPVINLSQRATQSATDEMAGGGSGFVTPTLAEIYVKQGWFDDAIRAYKTLAASKPEEREKFERRIKEIEEEKAKAGS